MLEPPSVSVAIPVFNEEAVVGDLLRRLGAVLDDLPGASHEIVIVDDGSSDRTAQALRRLSAGEHRLVVIELSRNFGHQRRCPRRSTTPVAMSS